MRKHFSRFRIPPGASKDPRFIARAILGILLFANLVAAYTVFQPLGGSAEELEEQLAQERSQVQRAQANLQRTRTLVAKIQQARSSGDEFLQSYFMDRRTTSSSILGELSTAAKDAGIRFKEHTYVIDPVEGSDTLSMMTISGNYEGTYGDLVEYINRLDRSRRFLIIDTLTAAPVANGTTLNVNIKLNTFVREQGPTPAI